jgi:hypothetical protein
MQARPRDHPDQLAASFPLDRQHQSFNTICRQLIKEAVTLFVPEWLNLSAACYEIKTNFIIRTETIGAADIVSEEGVHQGCPLGPALFCLGLRLVHLLVRHARGDAVIPEEEGVSAYALQRGTWQTVLMRAPSTSLPS